jgi:hypothetical protein
MRRLRPDRNPLRRRTDRAETALIAALLAAFLAFAPFAAITAAHWAHAAGLREQRSEQASWHEVPAVLLQNAPADTYVQYGPSITTVRGRWTGPDGSRHTGYVSAPAGARAGTAVRAWTDDSGQLTGSPLQPAQVADRAALAGMVAPMVAAILLFVAWRVARREIDKRRSAAWEADWWATGPQWTRRL